MATAKDSRWRMPSGRLSGKSSITARKSKRCAISSMRAGISPSGTWNRRACSTRFWRTVSSLYSEKACDM
ncbi:hypothetical protein D3C72_1892500 [compost metagenome]